MWRDKSPGLKILWLWTFGTAAVMVTNVVRTRMRDMEQFINSQEQEQQQQTPQERQTPPSDSVVQVIREEDES